jgi:hypothetical protein
MSGEDTKRCRVTCEECGELEADTEDGLFSEKSAHRRAGFHEGIQEDNAHVCTVEVVEENLSDVQQWERHNDSFEYDPPELPGERWSSEQTQELYDRVIRRKVQWFCTECSGHGPIGTLSKARRHVESNHAQKLIEKHETPREDLEAATDGGSTDVDRRQENNQQLSEWSE